MGLTTLTSWHQVTPGQWERDIDEAEQFYASIAKTWEGTGHTYFAINACAGLFIPLPDNSDATSLGARFETVVRHAWLKLRYDHPNLAAPLEFDPTTKICKKVYKIPSTPDEVSGWLDQSFQVIDNGKSGEDVVNSDFPVLGYPALYLITPPNQGSNEKKGIRRDLVFHTHHGIIDGVGTFILFGSLLSHVAAAFTLNELPDIKFGTEYTRLSPSLRVAAGLPSIPSPSQTSRLESIQAANLAARNNDDISILKVPFTNPTSKPGISKRTAIHLTPSESQAVLHVCKAVGASPTHAFHTGIAIALRDLQEKHNVARAARYISYSMINLRAACHPPFNTATYAAAVYHSVSDLHLVVDLTIPALSTPPPTKQETDEFFAALLQVGTFYKNTKITPDYLSTAPSLFAAVTPPFPETPCEVPASDPSPSASLSSFGVIDRIIRPKYGDIEVIEPWLMGAEYSTGLGLFLGTWDGKMGLSAAYNTTFHLDEQVLEYLQRIKTVVLEGLGIA